jgi:hypothetical protein
MKLESAIHLHEFTGPSNLNKNNTGMDLLREASRAVVAPASGLDSAALPNHFVV